MSRSNPTAKNPATRFIRWRGGEEGGGRLTWYNKETETEEEIKLPFSFLVLDELNTITGYSEKDQSGFWSNEVKNLKNELVVRTGSGIVARGKYEDIGDAIKAKGAKYAKSVYIAFKNEEGELVIGNLQVAGAALTAWIEFQKKFNVMECAVLLSGAKGPLKKGTTKYFVPIFEGQAVSAETDAAATALDKELQAFLSVYLSRKVEDDSEVVDEPDDDEEDDSPTEPTTAPEVAAPAKPQPPKEVEEDDNKINLADVPF